MLRATFFISLYQNLHIYIFVHEKEYKYPIYGELIKHTPSDDEYTEDSYIFKELLTGLYFYRGYTHPLKQQYFETPLKPYTHPSEIIKSIKSKVGPFRGVYFDEFSYNSDIEEVSPEEIKDYYLSIKAGHYFKDTLTTYLSMFDKILDAQNNDIDEFLMKQILFDRTSSYFQTYMKMNLPILMILF